MAVNSEFLIQQWIKLFLYCSKNSLSLTDEEVEEKEFSGRILCAAKHQIHGELELDRVNTVCMQSIHALILYQYRC